MKQFHACLILIQLLSLAQTALADGPINCDEPAGPVLADDSPTKKDFEKLLALGADAPIEKFMILWYPDRTGTPNSDDTIRKCAESNSCPGDTGYSWGRLGKVKTMEAKIPDSGDWAGDPGLGQKLDTLFSAIGSFGYGAVPVRVRFRKPAQISPESEHWVTDLSQIESWSYATPEHYDEIVRDYLRYKTGTLWYGYYMVQQMVPGDRLYLATVLDGHRFNEAILKADLLQMIKMILNGEGRIYYAKGVCRNRRQEFQTGFPSYINPVPL